ncbi:MAG: hypothetical protein AAF202_12915, partial [Pseudomonadota bacterium]
AMVSPSAQAPSACGDQMEAIVKAQMGRIQDGMARADIMIDGFVTISAELERVFGEFGIQLDVKGASLNNADLTAMSTGISAEALQNSSSGATRLFLTNLKGELTKFFSGQDLEDPTRIRLLGETVLVFLRVSHPELVYDGENDEEFATFARYIDLTGTPQEGVINEAAFDNLLTNFASASYELQERLGDAFRFSDVVANFEENHFHHGPNHSFTYTIGGGDGQNGQGPQLIEGN